MIKDDFFLFLSNLEGFRSKPYRCPSGFLTIGYGHRIKKYESFKEITKEHALELLKTDFKDALNQLSTFDIPLQEHEAFAIADIVFNCGLSKLRNSRLVQYLRLYSDSLDKRNFSYANSIKNLIVKNLSEWCHYHTPQGEFKTSEGLKLRCDFRIKTFLNQPLY